MQSKGEREWEREKNSLRYTMGSCQHPLRANQSRSTQILIQRIDQSDLPAPFPILAIFTTDDSSLATVIWVNLIECEIRWRERFHGRFHFRYGIAVVVRKIAENVVVYLNRNDGTAQYQSLRCFAGRFVIDLSGRSARVWWTSEWITSRTAACSFDATHIFRVDWSSSCWCGRYRRCFVWRWKFSGKINVENGTSDHPPWTHTRCGWWRQWTGNGISVNVVSHVLRHILLDRLIDEAGNSLVPALHF